MTATAIANPASEVPGIVTLKSGIQLGFRSSPASVDGRDTPDTPAINKAFLSGLRASDYTHGLPNETFFAIGRQAWAGIRQDFTTTIAFPAGSPTEIAGYIVHANFQNDSGKAVAWLYVARPWRKFGIARALLAEAGIAKGQRFAVLFGDPQKLAVARSKGFIPAFLPWLHWRWLVDHGQPLAKLNA